LRRPAIAGTAGGGSGPSSDPSNDSASATVAGALTAPADKYSLQAVNFDRRRFKSVADCLTAASAGHLPLVLCR
jgi:hypothetical protein